MLSHENQSELSNESQGERFIAGLKEKIKIDRLAGEQERLHKRLEMPDDQLLLLMGIEKAITWSVGYENQEDEGEDEKGSQPRVALSIEEAAQSIGIGETKLKELLANPAMEFPRLKVGDRTLIPIHKIPEWLSKRTEKDTPSTLDLTRPPRPSKRA